MKLQSLFYIIILLSISFGCKNKTATEKEEKDIVPKEFYPVSTYIHSQLVYLDSVPLAIIKYTTSNNKVDTSIIEKKDFAAVAEQFAQPDISSAALKDQYEETSFMDATLGTISLTYAAKNDTALIRKTDVLLNQENTAVSTIYKEKKTADTDTGTMLKKMLWTAGRNCQVTTIIRNKNAPEKVLQEKYVWDDRP